VASIITAHILLSSKTAALNCNTNQKDYWGGTPIRLIVMMFKVPHFGRRKSRHRQTGFSEADFHQKVYHPFLPETIILMGRDCMTQSESQECVR